MLAVMRGHSWLGRFSQVQLRSRECGWLAGVIGLCACGQHATEASVTEQKPLPGVVLNLTTDLNVPQEIDSARFEVVYPDAPGIEKSRDDRELGPTGLTLPTRLTLQINYNQYDTDQRVRYRVVTWKGSTAILFSEALVTLSSAGPILVDQPLERACSGFAATLATGEVNSTCPDGQACRAGACASIDRSQEQFPLLNAGSNARSDAGN